MFLNELIPAALAQAVSNTSATGALISEKGGLSGVQKMIGFIISNLDNWIGGLVIIFASFMLANITALRIRNAILAKKGEEAQESVLVLVERITKIVIIGVGITIAAAINGFNFTAVIGALSLGIGFALKDVIGTFISSIILLSQDRIKIGDLIKIDEIIGTIISIDTRVTVLQSVDGSEVVIPNQQMLSSTIISFSTNPFRRIELDVGVDYNTDLPMVTSLIRGIIEKDKDIVIKPEPLVLVNEFGDSSINIKIYFWIESSKKWMKVRSNLAYRIKKTFNELGIKIPFPIRTLKLDEDDRAFLKTIDSMKKGIVPEREPVPQADAVRQAAEGTENAPHVPELIFEKPKTQTVPDEPARQPSQPIKEHRKADEPINPPPSHM